MNPSTLGRSLLLSCLLAMISIPAAARGENAVHKGGAVGKALVAAPRLRVRNAPRVSADPLGAVTEGMPLSLLEASTFTATIDEKHAPWYRVRTLSGKHLEGWAFGGYMDVAADSADGIDPWLKTLCYADIGAFGESPESAAAKLGTPLSTRAKEEPSRHEAGRMNKVMTTDFTGASLQHLETPYKTFLEQSVLTKDFPGLNDLLRMGATPRQVRGILGDPQRDDIKSMTYECNQEENDRIILRFTLDRLSAIEWSHPVD